ncbi:MAG: hypothetical protein ACKVP7_00840 [Hyphomicrobiaceae bacterium]
MSIIPSSRTSMTLLLLACALAAPTADAQSPPRDQAPQRTAQKAPTKPTPTVVHKLAIQVGENKPEIMNLALNNAKNVLEHFKARGEKVEVEIVTFGPGLHMLRDDTSPVKVRVAEMALSEPSLRFTACANTQANHAKAEQKTITLVSEAKLYPSGVVRLMELQKQGFAYVRP